MEAKWGAMTGARIISDLRRELGAGATVALLKEDAFAFLEAHARLKNRRLKLPAAFDKILAQAKAGAKR